MKKDLFVLLIFCVLLFSKSYAQEFIVYFETQPTAQSEALNLSTKAQYFATRAALTQTIVKTLERLQLEGYIDAKTQQQEYTNDQGTRVIKISFDLGAQWQDVIFSYPSTIKAYLKNNSSGLSAFDADKTLNDLLEKFSETDQKRVKELNYLKIPLHEVPNFLNQLNKSIAQDFSPFSELKLTELEPLKFPTITAKLQVKLFPPLKIDSLVIKGYSAVDQGFLKHRAGLKFPLPFKSETINQAEEILSSTPYIQVTRPSETLFEQQKTTLYMYLNKRVANQVEGILGFGSDPQGQSLKLNGYVNLQLWNNLNRSEQFDLRYKADGNQQERLEIQVGLPYIAKSPLGLQGRFDLFRRDSTFTTVTSGAQITYKPFGPLSLALGFTSIKSSRGSSTNLSERNISDFTQGLWGLEAQLQKERNSLLMPRRLWINLKTEFGSSEEKLLAENIPSETRLTNARQRFEFALDYLFDLWPNHYLWMHHNTVLINGDNLRLNELYRFGGTQSLRGFNENLLETSQLHLIQLEYRLSFSEAFYIHPLSDLGFYRNSIDEKITQNFSAGLGLATVTRAGILKVQIAQGFGKRTDFSTNNTKIHLVFNSRF
jgi:hypothetical protein